MSFDGVNNLANNDYYFIYLDANGNREKSSVKLFKNKVWTKKILLKKVLRFLDFISYCKFSK